MSIKPKILLLGDVIVDVTLTEAHQENKLRFGGIIHSVRALWALGIDYGLAYIAPGYLNKQIEHYVHELNAKHTSCIGTVYGAPNLIFVAEAKEIGKQGYELVLMDEYRCEFDFDALSLLLSSENYTDVVIFAGQFHLAEVITCCLNYEVAIHVDVSNWRIDHQQLPTSSHPLRTLFLSTSSANFLETYEASVQKMCDDLLGNVTERIVFKENRGGSRFFDVSAPDIPFVIGAQLRRIVHSVGVGDVYDVVFIALESQHGTLAALHYASWVAAEYASTTYPDKFKSKTQNVLLLTPEEITSLFGVSMFWEKRKDCQIYIAAPDFDYMDTTHIDTVAKSLTYHNFTPRLPVRENGQMGDDDSIERKRELFDADMAILGQCQLLLAVMLNNDPGTLIEIGLAAAKGIPVLVYDPHRIAKNLMLTELPALVSSDLDEIVAKVFDLASRLV